MLIHDNIGPIWTHDKTRCKSDITFRLNDVTVTPILTDVKSSGDEGRQSSLWHEWWIDHIRTSHLAYL